MAPPGSGKTEVAAELAKALIDNGAHPQSILLTTFNVDAAEEIENRLKEKGVNPLPLIRNYHKVGARMCRYLANNGFIPNSQICMDTSKISALAKAALSNVIGHVVRGDLNPSDPVVIENFLSFIALVKSDIIGPEITFEKSMLEPSYKPFIDSFYKFEELRVEAKVRTQDDLLYEPAMAIRKHPELADMLTGRLSNLIIDEYQDINPVGNFLFLSIAGKDTRVTCIGDDDQTINTFRGSRPEFIVSDFTKQFPTANSKYLLYTHRYGHAISIMANALIGNNTTRVDKLCVSAPSTPNSQIYVGFYNASYVLPYTETEQKYLINEIQRYINSGRPLHHVAVLLRTFHLAPYIECALMRANIPYRIKGSKSIKQNSNMLCVKAFTDIVGNRQPTLQQKTRLRALFFQASIGLRADQISAVIPLIEAGKSVSRDALKRLLPGTQDFILDNVVKHFSALNGALAKSHQQALNIFFNDYLLPKMDRGLEKKPTDSQRRAIAVLKASVEYAKNFVNSYEFGIDLDKQHEAEDAITICTIHSSKGLAWPVVFIPGLCETIFPMQANSSHDNEDDERRLLYVGVTRAKEHLHIIVPESRIARRHLNGEIAEVPVHHIINANEPSRFFYELRLFNAIELAKALHSQSNEVKLIGDISIYQKYLTKIDTPIEIKHD